MPETAKRTARVPILGEDGRISDDYIPAAIGEGVESAEAAATRAETAATDAQGSATAAGTSATKAQESATAAGNAKTAADTAQKGAESAKTEAETAKEAAEAAKTGAESARGSAQTAATKAQESATAAEESATKVADKFISSAQATTLEPGSQATASVADQVLTLGIPRGDKGEKGDKGDKGDPGDVSAVQTAEGSDLSVSTDGGTVTIDDSALRARIAELENQAANVVTGTATGKVAHAEDAYATKPRKLTVQGKTRQNLWMNPSGTGNGVTVTANDNGSVTVSGTSTGIFNPFTQIYTVRPESTYTLSVDKVVQSSTNASAGCFFIEIHDGDSTLMTKYAGFGTTVSVTFTAPADTTFTRVGFYCSTGTTVSGTYRVMLNEGSAAEPWCPPGLNSVGDGGSVDIVTAGKNLIDFSKFNPAYYDVSGDGLKIVKADEQAWSNIHPMLQLPPGDYTLSCAGATNLQISTRNVGYTGWGTSSSSSVHLSAPSEIAFKLFADVDTVVYPQLELGSTATDYEPPTVTMTPLPEVELRSLPSGTCDELVIKADGTCEVERRTGYIASYTDEEVTGEYVSTGNGLEAGASIVYELDEPTTEPQSPVTLPTLPAPTFNQYHDADVPSDTSTEYVRDINIVLDNLAKQVAGTASAVAVREASTIEEE